MDSTVWIILLFLSGSCVDYFYNLGGAKQVLRIYFLLKRVDLFSGIIDTPCPSLLIINIIVLIIHHLSNQSRRSTSSVSLRRVMKNGLGKRLFDLWAWWIVR